MAVTQTDTAGVLNMHGKEYMTVPLRITLFRQQHPTKDGWGISHELLAVEPGLIRMRATITDPQGRVVATGHAQLAGGKANQDKALEKVETTATGRALAAAGFIGDSYASAEELADWLSGRETDHRVAAKKREPGLTAEAAYEALFESSSLTMDELDQFAEDAKEQPLSALTDQGRHRAVEYLSSSAGRERLLRWRTWRTEQNRAADEAGQEDAPTPDGDYGPDAFYEEIAEALQLESATPLKAWLVTLGRNLDASDSDDARRKARAWILDGDAVGRERFTVWYDAQRAETEEALF